MNLSKNMTDEEIAEFNKRQEFVRDASPERWIGYSGELQEAAMTLWQLRGDAVILDVMHRGGPDDQTGLTKGPNNPRAFVLLAGFAIENSLKALLIVEQPTLVTDAKLLKPLKTHRLLGLMDRIKTLTFSKSERQVAVVCESAIPYWGRYPVPLNYEQVASEHFLNDSFTTILFHSTIVFGNLFTCKSKMGGIPELGQSSLSFGCRSLKLTNMTCKGHFHGAMTQKIVAIHSFATS